MVYIFHHDHLVTMKGEIETISRSSDRLFAQLGYLSRRFIVYWYILTYIEKRRKAGTYNESITTSFG
jgi:hypothetical protein